MDKDELAAAGFEKVFTLFTVQSVECGVLDPTSGGLLVEATLGAGLQTRFLLMPAARALLDELTAWHEETGDAEGPHAMISRAEWGRGSGLGAERCTHTSPAPSWVAQPSGGVWVSQSMIRLR